MNLAVRYTRAEQFVADYIENLSGGGLYVAGAHTLPLSSETDVTIDLPGQGSWTVLARVQFIIDEDAAKASGRKPGAGMEIIGKPPGFDDALLGYLLRLGQRRDHSVMVGNIAGVRAMTDSGYRIIPLESPEEADKLLVDALVKLVAILVPVDEVEPYVARIRGDAAARVIGVKNEGDIPDVLARIDSMLGS